MSSAHRPDPRFQHPPVPPVRPSAGEDGVPALPEPDFSVAWRGYDRRQVDAYIARLRQQALAHSAEVGTGPPVTAVPPSGEDGRDQQVEQDLDQFERRSRERAERQARKIVDEARREAAQLRATPGGADEVAPDTLLGGRYELATDAVHPGEVVPARDRQADSDVEVVVLDPVPTPAERTRLLHLTRRVAHDEVGRSSPLVDVGTHGAWPYLVVQPSVGESLSAITERRGGTLPPAEAATVTLAVSKAVVALRSQGLVPLPLRPGLIRMDDGVAHVLPGATTPRRVGRGQPAVPRQPAERDVPMLGRLMLDLLGDHAAQLEDSRYRRALAVARRAAGEQSPGYANVRDFQLALRAMASRTLDGQPTLGRSATGSVEARSGGRAGVPRRGSLAQASTDDQPGSRIVAAQQSPPWGRSIAVGLVAALVVLLVGVVVTL